MLQRSLRLAVNFGLESRQVISNDNSNDHVVSDAYVNFIPFGSSRSRSQLVAQFGISAMIRLPNQCSWLSSRTLALMKRSTSPKTELCVNLGDDG